MWKTSYDQSSSDQYIHVFQIPKEGPVGYGIRNTEGDTEFELGSFELLTIVLCITLRTHHFLLLFLLYFNVQRGRMKSKADDDSLKDIWW